LIGFAVEGAEWLFVLVACIWGMTVIADSVQFSAIITEVASPSLVGTALTFQIGIGFLITILVIWIIPHFAERIGSWRWSFLILSPGPILGAIAMERLNRLAMIECYG
jgi:MFS family permease